MRISAPRWSYWPTASSLYCPEDGARRQVWQIDAGSGARQITWMLLDVNNFRLSPDGKRLLVSPMDVFTDEIAACTTQRLDARKADKATGTPS